MFSWHHELAQATVLYTGDITSDWGDQAYDKMEYVLEVHTPTGQVFRAKATHRFIRFTHTPQVGDVVKVKYDPRSQKVELELRDDLRYGVKHMRYVEQMEHQAGRNQRDALLAAPPGTPLPSAGRPGGAGIHSLDAELLELMALEEAERQQSTAGTSWPAQQQVAPGLAEEQRLRQELMYSGLSGRAQLMQKRQAGAPSQQFVPFFVTVQVHPDMPGQPFECSFMAWVDTSKGYLQEGYVLPVRYDPQNTARIVFIWPA